MIKMHEHTLNDVYKLNQIKVRMMIVMIMIMMMMVIKVRNEQIRFKVVNVVFHHVVEREFMLRLCPCVMSHCTCETISPGSQVGSRIMRVNNTGEDQVFPWCRGVQQAWPWAAVGLGCGLLNARGHLRTERHGQTPYP